MNREKGFSVISLLIPGAIIAALVIATYHILPVYNANWKVQDMFDSMASNLATSSEADIRSRLPDLMKVKYLTRADLPEEFFDNLSIEATGSKVTIQSSYHVTVWLLGPVEGVDPKSDYSADELKGMDRVRNKLRFDFDFEPYATTP